ncbi:MAG: hypothetical protein KAR45_11745, partial [Desulfobacteraceae bacterium]|nr:hypothetical protein [Desulfobacteraceae bacterium]
MRHPNLIKWEKDLKKVFDRVDDFLEDKYGKMYPLHPSRAVRGKTSNKEMDGLFNVGAAFSAGFGSKYGRGYVIEVLMVTLDHIPDEIKKYVVDDAIEEVKTGLSIQFPDRKLYVDKDGNVFKIHG